MINLLFLGGSTQLGLTRGIDGEYFNVVDSEAKVCGDLLKESLGSDAVNYENAAIKGTAISDWCNGSELVLQSYANRMIANHSVTHVILQVGINDAYSEGITIAAWRWCLGEMYRLTKLYGKKIIFCTPNPIDNMHNGKLWELQHNLKDVAAFFGVQVIDHYAAITSATPGWTKLLSDEIHPRPELYRFKGATSFMAIRGTL